MPDKDLEQAIFDNISQIIGFLDKDELRAVEELTAGQRASYAVWRVESEVNNGGFYQFYQNSTGVFGSMAVEGFRTFGAHKFAALMAQAETLRYGYLSGDDSLPDLDKEFYSTYGIENLNQLRIDYTRSHIEEFI